MACSLSPIIVCVLAYFISGEKMERSSLLFFVAVFFSCMLVLVGAGRNHGSDDNEVHEAASTLALIGLIAMPCLVGG